MKILGISGSNRKDGNSYSLLNEILKEASTLETKIIQVAELNVRPCELCFDSCAEEPFECALEDDLGAILAEMKSAHGVIIACPFYFYVPAKFQAFMERISSLDYFTQERHGQGFSPFNDKPCAHIVVSASGSSFNAFQILHHLQEFALMLGMHPIVTNTWPFIGLSAKSGGMEKGAILKEKKIIEEAKGLVKLLIREMERRKQ
jgi:multimeric flavodoxin WrbA